MKLILNILFIFSVTAILAQAPGYLGKRLVLGYGAHFSPAFSNANNQNQTIVGHKNGIGSAETGVIAFNYTHEGFIEYATSSKFMIGFSGKFYKTKYDNAASSYIYNNNSNNSQLSNDVQGYFDISGQSLCLYGKFYSGRYVAPWGRYIVLGPVLNLYSTSYDPAVMFQKYSSYYSSTPNPAPYTSYGSLKQSFTGFNVLFGWGRTRIVGSRVTLDYGVNMQVFSLFSIIPDVLRDVSDVSPSIYIENNAAPRIRGLNRINAFLKVGFLVF